MKVGILELLSLPSEKLSHSIFHLFITKQYASITPQTISVWCRQLGHESYYATYYGVGKAHKKLPENLDIVFISSCSQAAPLAYSLAKLYRKAGVKTVMGGPHAKSFPQDCLRFFDIVVKHCDKNLIIDILADRFAPGSSISSAKSFSEIPSVKEREPEIRASAFFRQRWRNPLMAVVPMMTSMGCPYACDFCTDWDNPYQVLPAERLVTDVKYVAQHLPGSIIGFTDPNFAVKFNYVIEALESIPPKFRVPYVMECSLSILNESRIERLNKTNCLVGLFGLESWYDYTNKSGGVQKHSAQDKLSNTINRFKQLKAYISYLQANFIFGVDSDEGDEPVAMTKEFMQQTPHVWPVLNVPVPFGGTPMQEHLLNEGRVLKTMPFNFYYLPFLVIRPKNYDLIEYFEKLLDISSFIVSDTMLKQRMQSGTHLRVKMLHRLRTMFERDFNRHYQQTLNLLRSDSHFLAFHEGRSEVLPDFYRQIRNKSLGHYASLLLETDWIPDLNYQEPIVV